LFEIATDLYIKDATGNEYVVLRSTGILLEHSRSIHHSGGTELLMQPLSGQTSKHRFYSTLENARPVSDCIILPTMKI